jgi:type I restriction enzyme, S subunit
VKTIPWLGNYGGETVPVKRSYELLLGKMVQPSANTRSDIEVEYLNSASIQWDGVEAGQDKKMWASPVEIRNLSVKPGDLLICEGGDIGRATIYNGPSGLIFQNSVHRARSCQGSDVRYLKYLLNSLYHSGWLEVLCNRATIAHLTCEKLGSIEVPRMQIDEQRRIADFLDAETARIDELVSLRNLQVNALSSTLYGEVAHKTEPEWQRTPLRRIVDAVQTGTTPTDLLYSSASLEGMPWYTPAALGGILDLSETGSRVRWEDAHRVPRFPSGSILIVGIGESLGKVADLDHEATGNQQLTAIRTSSAVDQRFVTWQLFRAYDEIRAWAQYSRVRILNNDVLKSFTISIPPIDQQIDIRKRLDRRLSYFQNLRDAARRFSLLASERRRALIKAAVTGEIDVTTAGGGVG